MKGKRNAILIILLIIILGVIGGLAIYQRTYNLTPEDILEDMFSIESYETEIIYDVKNSRGQFQEKGRIYYDEEVGTKTVLDDREQLFEKDKIIINYVKDEKTYEVGRDYDQFYRFMFINELKDLCNEEHEFTYKWNDENEKSEIILEFKNLNGNENFSREVMIIDAKKKVPKEAIIYDRDDLESVYIKFNNFSKVKN
ncbi:germination lipoprotein GerS-related protein [Clostridium perfringens]|uniref:germination lipoprotein GerS-related protein n=1 Tax=Clostridium perfringens TaxID=1502 RepID=UPI001CC523F7|nr:germination lipoprotein GerS-related protein [Clostridium perfringens]CAG9354083.1 membrane associated protein [Clostridium perfringens]